MLEIFICEDNLAQRTSLEQLIQQTILLNNWEMTLRLNTENPLEILTYLEEYPQTQGVYFLDIDLNTEMNGIQLGAEIRNRNPHGKIIFITTHDELLPLTFQYKVEAMDYIAKDNREEITQRVTEALRQANQHYLTTAQALDERIRFEIGNRIRWVELSDVMFVETVPGNSHKLILHLRNGSVSFLGNLKEIEQLSPAFYRVHKSFVANKQNIREIDQLNRELIFSNGEKCFVGRRQLKQLI
ncbi:LytR/AlgR family response regulator transcription factor [Enterococcus eurekensis]|uniref:LytR/AlgR family response regulator transcription factor n=1 Tax=Enterococcus eurekensis TaxID=1159753 RepID=A0ABV9M796_9ENTE